MTDLNGYVTKRRDAAFPLTGGGCPNHSSWKSNPQFALEIQEDDSEFYVNVMQFDARMRTTGGKNAASYHQQLGFFIAKFDWGVPESVRRLHTLVRHEVVNADESLEFKPVRNIQRMYKLEAGKYVLVPMFYNPDQGGKCVVITQCSAGFEIYGGDEVDSRSDEGDGIALDDDMVGEWVAVQPGQVAEEDEVEEDNEEKTLQAMQSFVGDLASLVKKLQIRKRALLSRISKLEAES